MGLRVVTDQCTSIDLLMSNMRFLVLVACCVIIDREESYSSWRIPRVRSAPVPLISGSNPGLWLNHEEKNT